MDWKEKVRAALASASPVPDDDVLEELSQHARAEYDAARAEGASVVDAEARVADLLTRWNADASVLRHRSRRPVAIEPPPAISPSWFSGIGRDTRYAARLLRREPRYSIVAIVTMALGIGATTLLFSITYGVLMKPLPWPSADRVVVLKETRGGAPPRFGAFTNAAYFAWKEQATTIDALAAWTQRTVTMTGRGDAERIRVTAASATVFDVLGVRPLLGALFDARTEASPVVILSESLWRQRFGADPVVLGAAIHLDGQAHTVVGVLPDRVGFPDGLTRAWIPLVVRPSIGKSLSMFNAVARLKPGSTAAQAAAEGTARGRYVADTGMTTIAIFGNNGPLEVAAQPLQTSMTADVRRPLIVMLVAVALLLFTATGNVASLQLARATSRQREMSIRTALGASRVRVSRQLLVESLLVSLIGGVAGVAFAWLLHRFVPSVLPADFPRVDALSLNGLVILFAAVVSVATGVLCGLFPALRLRRVNLVTSLTEDSLAPIGAGTRSMMARARAMIIAGQVAIACVLLVGSALLGRSFFVLLNTNRGYDPSDVLTARVTLPPNSYQPERRYLLVHGVLERLASTPGVSHAGFTSEFPLGPGGSTAAFSVRSPVIEGGSRQVQTSPRIVSPGYFATMGIRVVDGRGFTESDNESAAPVVVVNRTFARRFVNDAAVGAKVPMGVAYGQDDREATIVGVIDDVRYLTADDSSLPELYYSSRQFGGRLPVSVVTLVVRATDDPGMLVRPLRTAVREADQGIVADGIATMDERVLRGLARPRLYAIVLGGFAAAALLVAAVGLFGVLSYTVAQRSRELAVRTALGARRVDVMKLVIGQMIAVASVGIAAGLGASLVLTRSLGALLHGVTHRDLTTYVVVPLILIAVTIAASLPPAIRAARIDPLRALRH